MLLLNYTYILAYIIMLLEKYKNHRRLGKGAFGCVYLVEDVQGRLYALKVMPTKKMKQQPHLKNYLLGQIQCLKEMNSINIIKLYNVQQDNMNIYLLLQYCDGGDLAAYQANLPDKVFSIDLATVVLTQVIIGLGDLHRQGYLHRDIKLQNVLIKNQNGRTMYKLADFGFSKKIEDIAGTTLGTQNFMSPQIYSDSQSYGFEVDMWAFGVLFFFMLNLQYPFQINPRLPTDFKKVALGKLAVDFSYLKAVKRTKKKLLHNCSDDMQDLFNRIFEVDPNQRITFSQIRQHPVFSKHFITIPQPSKNIYNNPIKTGLQLKLTKLQTIKQSEDYLELSLRTTRQSDSMYKQQKQILCKRKIEIDFLRHNVFQFLQVGTVLKTYQKLMLTFHLLKYYIVLLRTFKNTLNKNDLSQTYPGLKWQEYLNTRQFIILLKEINNDLLEHQNKFVNLCDHCEVFLQQISQANSSFPQNFQKNITETAFEGVFKQSYRKSTVHVFGVLLPVLRNKTSKKGNKINYLIAQLLVCHAFNNLFSSLDNLSIIFKQYFQEKEKNADQIDYSELREWMAQTKDTILNNITKRIIKIFFTS